MRIECIKYIISDISVTDFSASTEGDDFIYMYMYVIYTWLLKTMTTCTVSLRFRFAAHVPPVLHADLKNVLL